MSEVLRLAAGCRPAEDLLAYHENTLAPERREELRLHLDGCPACRAAIDFLAATDAASAAAEGSPLPLPEGVEERLDDLLAQAVSAPAASTRRLGSRPWLRLAASLLVASSLVVTGWLWLAPDGSEGDGGALRSKDRLVTLGPVGRLAVVPERFIWSPHPQARDYHVILLDEKMVKIWSGFTADDGTSLELNAEARRLLAAGGRFSWQVLARNRRGSAFDQSPITHFEIAGPAPTR